MASLLAEGKNSRAISIKVAALAEGVINAMMINKLKTARAALYLILAITALGVDSSFSRQRRQRRSLKNPSIVPIKPQHSNPNCA